MTTGCSNPAELTNDTANGGVTLERGTCYEVSGQVTVNDGVLAIEPDVQIFFGQNASMVVNGSGALRAEGEADAPVVFTGAEELRGHWKGLAIETVSADNILDYVELEYAGSDQWTGAENSIAALRVEGKVQVTNSVFRESAGWALQAFEDADISGFAGNTFEANEVPAWLHPNRVGELSGDTTFTDNDDSFVQVAFSNTDTVTSEQTWAALGVPYRMSDRSFVGAPLTIEAGATLEFGQDFPFIVNNNGSLTAVGDESNPITFTGIEQLRGFWKGIQIQSNASANQLDYVTIEYAGSSQWTGSENSTAGLRVEGKAQVTNSTFRENGGSAVMAYEESDLTGFAANTFDSNEIVMWLFPDRVGELAGTSTFTNNDLEAILIAFGNTNAVTTAQTWQAFSAPYRVVNRMYVGDALTVEAGATVRFTQNSSFYVQGSGSLTLDGTASDPITFAGVEDLQGFWKGISIETATTNNVFRHTEIANAGSTTWTGAENSDASVIVGRQFGSAGRLEVDNVDIRDSKGNAIRVTNGELIGCGTLTTSGIEDTPVVAEEDGTTDC